LTRQEDGRQFASGHEKAQKAQKELTPEYAEYAEGEKKGPAF
jgi:hypothetical protein